MSYTVKSDDQKGHFRIGCVNLSIPPEDWAFHKVSNSDEIMPLRAKFSHHIRTGHSRWDLTVRWKALLGNDPTAGDFWQQWEDVRTMVAMVKAAPFVDVENEDVRRFLSEKDPSYDKLAPRMAFALRQLMITTSADIIDGLDCALTMSLFNYLPYTKDFEYDQVRLADYLRIWKQENLDRPFNRTAKDEEAPSNWIDQDPHGFELAWRKYYIQKGNPSEAHEQVEDGLKLKDLPVDHFTSQGTDDCVTFRYKRNALSLTANTDGTSLEKFVHENEHGLYVQQISVVFANNLAILPLASYQYPTNQHIGPAGTMVSVAFQQKGYEATGIPTINTMLSTLEEQFLRMRTQWRSVASVHRMQALFCTNQILNMLGIFGLKDSEFTFENVKETSDVVQAQLVASQYENVFEQLEPFKVKGPLSGYADAFEDTFVKAKQMGLFGSPDGATTDEQKQQMDAIRPVVEFQAAREANDERWLQNYFTKEPDSAAQIAGMVAMPTKLTDAEKQALADASAFYKQFPHLQDRAANKDFSYVEFFILSRSMVYPTAVKKPSDGTALVASHQPAKVFEKPKSTSTTQGAAAYENAQKDQLKTAITAARNRVEADAEKQANAIRGLYDSLFKLRCAKDELFKGALEKMLANPELKKAFQDAVNVNGPGLEGSNAQHGAYQDLGLRGLVVTDGDGMVADFSPAYYFKDYGKEIYKETSENLKTLIPKMMKGYAQFNEGVNGSGVSAYPSELAVADGNPLGIMARTTVPLYSMRAAFPTYKLFLMEEDNNGVYYCFDDFYSYSSVIEIEVENHKDRGATAVIQLTNLASLLSHKLFDNSTLGKLERKHYKWLPKQGMANDGEATAISGGVETGVTAYEKFGGENRQEGIDSNGRPKSVPLKYFALQTGTKLQVRMGYSNNPDELYPVFQGIVTEVDGTDILTITAQGFQIELTQLAPDELKADGYSPVGLVGEALLNADHFVTDLLQFRLPSAFTDLKNIVTIQKAPAYGGVRIFGDAGDTGSVIGAMLKVSSAKHFGHWQVAQATDPYLKGFTWSAAIGSWMDDNSTLGSMLRSAYDRRDENILVNHIVNWDGTHNPGAFKRSFNFEDPAMFVGTPPEYHVPKIGDLTPWRIIKDVSRRYPEFVLAVKPYGFPFQSDATLVFAHPLDWYYSRLPMIGEKVQDQKLSAADQSNFLEWWTKGGKTRFIKAANMYVRPQGTMTAKGAAADDLLHLGENMAAEINNDPAACEAKIQQLLDRINSSPEAILTKTPFHSSTDKWAREAKTSFLYLLNDMRQTVAILRDPGSNLRPSYSSRVKPVRRFHFVNHNDIINNGIVVFEKFNNTVQLDGDIVPANAMIPHQHRRVLNVDGQILNIEDNLRDAQLELRMSYAQSFLREEVGKMYRGELLLRLMPEVEPNDIVMITDPSTGMVGPVEVESVIHTINQDMGAVTIIRPRALVLLNEAATATFLGAIWQAINTCPSWPGNFAAEFNEMSKLGKTTAVAAGVTIAAAAITTLAVFGGPPGWVLGALAAYGLMFIAGVQKNLNPVFVAPLTRFGKPWVGGLEGYRVVDIGTYAVELWDRMVTEEIAPTIESYRMLQKGLNPFGTAGKEDSSWRPNTPPKPVKGMSKEQLAQIDTWLQRAAKDHDVPYALLRAMLGTESNGNINALSKKGAMGLMQLMPKTAKSLGVTDPYDPRQNINAGARYVREQYNRYGRWDLALAAYNAGPVWVSGGGRTREHGPYIPAHAPAIPNIAETRAYVNKIMRESGLS